MYYMDADLRDEVNAIKSKLADMHDDIKRFMEQSNQQHLASILDDCRNKFSGIILGYAEDEIESGLESNMVKGCHMKETCNALFHDLLENNLGQIRRGDVSEDSINHTRSKMEQMRKKAPYEQCRDCFSEAARLFDKQLELMRSLRVYRDSNVMKEQMNVLSEEGVVIEVLEPLSNRQRLQMLKALSTETMTFSSLSALTNLRGGNLLFHLQKLLDSGMILQRHERGDYMITEKGFKALRGITELYSDLTSAEVEAKTALLRAP